MAQTAGWKWEKRRTTSESQTARNTQTHKYTHTTISDKRVIESHKDSRLIKNEMGGKKKPTSTILCIARE